MNLIMDVEDPERLPDDEVPEPEEDVVGVAADTIFHRSLNCYNWNANHHQSESNAVDYAKHTDDNILVEKRREGERN